MTTIRKASLEDAPAIGSILANAFSTDPLVVWMLGTQPGDTADRRLRAFFTSLAAVNVRKQDHELFVTHDGDGAAVWHGVDRWKVPGRDIVRTLPEMLRGFRHRLPVTRCGY